jgi:S1-C subfamily serine protease
VKITTTAKKYNYDAPWQPPSQITGTGTGCIIEGNKILTNAHVIANYHFIEVKRSDSARSYPAKVLHVAHDCDLALLSVNDPNFFKNSDPLPISEEIPKVGDSITVQGYPIGGTELCMTSGVVSRTELAECAHSRIHIMLTQIDAPINPGNSGGPVIKDNKLVGIAAQGISGSQNIGYIIPLPTIKRFFKDIKGEKYKGIPSINIFPQTMENEDLRRYFKADSYENGILLSRISPCSSVKGLLKPGDVILSIDGIDIAADGTFNWRERERVQANHLIQRKLIGETLLFRILRDGTPMDVEVKAEFNVNQSRLVPLCEYDVAPSYYIYGGIVFQPLSQNFLEVFGEYWNYVAPKNMLNYFQNGELTPERKEIVVLNRVLPDICNQGYQTASYSVITSVNGIPVRDMKHLISLLTENQAEFLVIDLENDGKLVLDRKKIWESHKQILENYGIPFDRSIDLR